MVPKPKRLCSIRWPTDSSVIGTPTKFASASALPAVFPAVVPAAVPAAVPVQILNSVVLSAPE